MSGLALELALGIASLPGTIDALFKWGASLVRTCHAYRHADAELDDMILRVDLCWDQISVLLDVSKQVEATMTPERKDLQYRLFTSLHAKLVAAEQKFERIEQSVKLGGRAGKLKLAVTKETLSTTIAELESWQRLCEPSWFYWIKPNKLASPTVDVVRNNLLRTDTTNTSGSTRLSETARNFRRAFEKPSQSVFIREDALDGYNTVTIPHSSATVAINLGRPQRLIMDVVDIVPNMPVQTKNVRDFAGRLRQTEHSISGLLSCKGVVLHADKTHLSFLFHVPESYTAIQSLRHLLISGRPHDSLSDRIEMAKQIAKAVYYIHLYEFVHKNIRPETILSLAKAVGASVPSTGCLVGFEVTRTADGRTYSLRDSRWENNLYRHPQRQGDVHDYFVMQHDIYSLGVCLLEIGLWESFITYGNDGAAQPSPAMALAEDRSQLKDPSALKDHLVTLSRSKRLRGKMGTKYSKVVETCLTCLDKDNVDFGDEEAFQDEDGVEVGARYIEKILDMLNGVCA
ncbi:hypothetical protein CONLIGDRAFT_588619 [Coniochaeta ligniaria NRRL 30616]|uniref:Protein kinase domain-containing protein n=1 Tax=Coniochaeta ligniaria NRRL 30616 TaxID=1408157 RepID=A0A1J7J6I0_9PEZI|nr:hypothetical protein CONLIGDRAFT_588619 [Coniochaeta ligniaria NRRL 30616]